MDGHGFFLPNTISCTAHLRALSFFPEQKYTSRDGKRMVWNGRDDGMDRLLLLRLESGELEEMQMPC